MGVAKAASRRWLVAALLVALVLVALPLPFAPAPDRPRGSSPERREPGAEAPARPGKDAGPAKAARDPLPGPTATAPPANTRAPAPGEELVERRTETSKTFATEKPGKFLTRVASEPIHFRSADGRWSDIDTTLVPKGPDRLAPRATPANLELAANHDSAALARLQVDGSRSIAFGLQHAGSGAARPDRNKVTYAGIRPDTDLELQAQPQGLKEDIVLASRSAPDVFVFPLQLEGLTASLDHSSGSVRYTDARGRVRAVTPRGFMQDAKADPNSGEGAVHFGVTYSLVRHGGKGTALRVSLDRAWLDDPARAYPVRVDPSVWVSTDREDDTYVMSNFVRDNAYDHELKVGTYDGGAHLGRSYMNFDVNALNNKVINSATFWSYNLWSWSCSPRGVGLYRVAQGWYGHTMTGFPGAALGERVGWAAYAMGYPGCPAGWAGYDVAGTVHNWTHGVWPQFGLALAVDGVSERDNYAWKKFGSWNWASYWNNGGYPHIDITWSEPPRRDVVLRSDGVSGYTLDGYGGVHPFGGAPPVGPTAYWPGWDIARDIVLRPDGKSGYTLDGYGGVHPFGGAPPPGPTAYWGGWDIARDIVLRPDGKSGYTLDGYGGVHPFGGAPPPGPTAYWPGWDIAREMVLRPDGKSGYTLDGYGGVHPFGGAPPPGPTAYWGGWDIARDIVLGFDGKSGYTLDGYGGVHPFGGAPSVKGSAYFGPSDAATAMALAPDGVTGQVLNVGGSLHRFAEAATGRAVAVRPDGRSGYTLDGWGGVRPFGGAPAVGPTAYWQGWDIARDMALRDDGVSGYTLDGYGGVHPFGGAPPVGRTEYPGRDIMRGIALRPDGKSGYTLDGYGGVHPFGGAPPVSTTASWPGWDIARDIVLRKDGVSGYVLDGYGGVQPFGGAPSVGTTEYPGWDIMRGIALRSDGKSGYTLDGRGGVHPFGGAPAVKLGGHWPGWDAVRDLALVPNEGSGYVVDAYANPVRFYVDDNVPPTPPTTVTSTSHMVGVPSNDRTVDVTWSGATDDRSGIKGYSWAFNNSAHQPADETQDGDASTSATTSPSLGDGDWYFHVRSIDGAANVSADKVLGPFTFPSPPPGEPECARQAEAIDRFVGAWKPRITDPEFGRRYLAQPGYPPEILAEGFHGLDQGAKDYLTGCLRKAYLTDNPAPPGTTQKELDDLKTLLFSFVFDKQVMEKVPTQPTVPEVPPAPPVEEVIPPEARKAVEDLEPTPAPPPLGVPPLGALDPVLGGFDPGRLLSEQGDLVPDVKTPTDTAGAFGILTSAGEDGLSRVGSLVADVGRRAGVEPPTKPVFEDLPAMAIAAGTFRLCSASSGRAAWCSGPLPLSVPQAVDVTGDGTIDVEAQLTPSADPTLPLTPGTGLPKGVTMDYNLTRLPTSEFNGQALRAHVWVVYDLAAIERRVWLGYDGWERGAGLSDHTRGAFTVDALAALQGGDLVSHYSLTNLGASPSLALTAKVATLRSSDDSELDPVSASVQLSPVPELIAGDVNVRSSASDTETRRQVELSADSSRVSRLDAIVVALRNSSAPHQRTTRRVVVEDLPTTALVQLTQTRRSDATATTDARLNAGTPIPRVAFNQLVEPDLAKPGTTQAFTGEALDVPAQATLTVDQAPADADFHLRTSSSMTAASVALEEKVDGALVRSGAARAERLPVSVDVSGGKSPTGGLNLTYQASGILPLVEAAMYDRDAEQTMAYGLLRDLPLNLSFSEPAGTGSLTYQGSGPVGSITASLARNGGRLYPSGGEHATLRIDGRAIGASLRISGLVRLQASWAEEKSVVADVSPGGQPFLAAALVDSARFGYLDVSNLPRATNLLVRPGARHLRYQASDTVRRASAHYTNLVAGPTAHGTLEDVPTLVDVAADAGPVPRARYQSDAPLGGLTFFFSPDPVRTLDLARNRYLFASAHGLPTSAEVALDLVARRLTWSASAPVRDVVAAARGVFGQSDDWSALAAVRGVPAQWDAEFPDGHLRFRGVSGPVESAYAAVTNHGRVTSYRGPHARVLHRQKAGVFDASVLVLNVSSFEYKKVGDVVSVGGSLDLGGRSFAVDGELVDPGDEAGTSDEFRTAVRGRLTNVPTRMSVTFGGSKVTYAADTNVGLELEGEYGWVAALSATPTPGWYQGVSVADGACGGGAGCRPASTRLCAGGACHGLKGRVSLHGLPRSVEVDLAARTAVLADVRVPSVAVVGVLRHLTPLPVTFYLRQDGIPAGVDLRFGPVAVTKAEGQPTKFTFETHHSAPLGPLSAWAESPVADRRARAEVSNVPADLVLSAAFGKPTEIVVRASSGIGLVKASAFVRVDHDQLSGSLESTVELRDVPAEVTLRAAQNPTGSDGSPAAPSLDYTASDSTLSGLVFVQGPLAGGNDTTRGHFENLFLGFTRLGSRTTVTVPGGDEVARTDSAPRTGHLWLGLSIGAKHSLTRHWEKSLPFGALVGEADVSVDGSAEVRGAAVGLSGFQSAALVVKSPYLAYGVTGNYERFSFRVDRFVLDAHVKATARVVTRWKGLEGMNPFFESPPVDVRVHQDGFSVDAFDQTKGEAVRWPIKPVFQVACVGLDTRPHRAQKPSPNGVSLGPGVEGDPAKTYSFTMVRPDVIPPWFADILMAAFLNPFERDIDIAAKFGGC